MILIEFLRIVLLVLLVLLLLVLLLSLLLVLVDDRGELYVELTAIKQVGVYPRDFSIYCFPMSIVRNMHAGRSTGCPEIPSELLWVHFLSYPQQYLNECRARAQAAFLRKERRLRKGSSGNFRLVSRLFGMRAGSRVSDAHDVSCFTHPVTPMSSMLKSHVT